MSRDVVFSLVRNVSLNTLHPIKEEALELFECHSIPDQCENLQNFFNLLECAILHISLQHFNEPNVALTQIWRINLVRKSFKLRIWDFLVIIRPLWHMELSIWTKNRLARSRHKIRLFAFTRSGRILWIKYSWVYVWSCGRASKLARLVSLKKLSA
jgi:hypothetical protein